MCTTAMPYPEASISPDLLPNMLCLTLFQPLFCTVSWALWAWQVDTDVPPTLGNLGAHSQHCEQLWVCSLILFTAIIRNFSGQGWGQHTEELQPPQITWPQSSPRHSLRTRKFENPLSIYVLVLGCGSFCTALPGPWGNEILGQIFFFFLYVCVCEVTSQEEGVVIWISSLSKVDFLPLVWVLLTESAELLSRRKWQTSHEYERSLLVCCPWAGMWVSSTFELELECQPFSSNKPSAFQLVQQDWVSQISSLLTQS